MATCITTIPAEATIRIGSASIKTPYILGINVSRTRGDLISKAAGSFQIQEDQLAAINQTGSNIAIYFYSSVVFTGTIKRIDASPSARCAGELVVRFQAEDFMHRIVNRAITRRQKQAGLGIMAFISGHQSRTTVGFDTVRDQHDISNSASPVTIFTPTVNMSEMTQFINTGSQNTHGYNHPRLKLSDPFKTAAGSAAGGGSFILHSHEDLTLTETGGGPAISVYGTR